MKCSKNEAQKIRRNVMRDILTYGIVIPYFGWAYFVSITAKAMLGSYFVLDVVVAIFMGVCLFFRYLRRDKSESIYSRVQCLAAAGWAMFAVGVMYTTGFNWALLKLLATLEIPVNGVVPVLAIIGVKVFGIYKTYTLIEPFGTQLVSSSYDDFDYIEDDEDDDTVSA